MDESQANQDDEVVDRLMTEMRQPDRRAPLVKRLNGVNILDFSDALGLYAGIAPHRKLLLLVLLLALKDMASELRFEPWVTETDGKGLRLFYEVAGQLYELVPPPQLVAEMILQEVKKVAGFDTLRRRFAGLLRRLACRLDAQTQLMSQSHFQMMAGYDKMDVSVTVYDSPMGDRVILRLPGSKASLSEKARDALKAILDSRALKTA